MSIVYNHNSLAFNFEEAVKTMDGNLRSDLMAKLMPCSEQEFFDAYGKAHLEMFGEKWPPFKDYYEDYNKSKGA